MPGGRVPNPRWRCNGAIADTRGRLLVTVYDESDMAAGGCVLRFERGAAPMEIAGGLALPKGLCLSPDGRRLSIGEMLAGRILVYDYDAEAGEVSGKRVFAAMAHEEGFPGGLAVDAEGFLWCAHWGGGKVARYSPEGAKDREYVLPVSIATALCFGGEDLGDLFVTTAWFDLSDEERETQPEAGDLFRIRSGVRGAAEREFED